MTANKSEPSAEAATANQLRSLSRATQVTPESDEVYSLPPEVLAMSSTPSAEEASADQKRAPDPTCWVQLVPLSAEVLMKPLTSAATSFTPLAEEATAAHSLLPVVRCTQLVPMSLEV